MDLCGTVPQFHGAFVIPFLPYGGGFFIRKMKTYSFAKLQARWYPTMEEIANPFIYGRVQNVVNVSELQYDVEMQRAFDEKGVSTKFLPLSENDVDMGMSNIVETVKLLENVDKAGMSSIVHCVGGDNRSRVVCECFHYRKCGFWPDDEYKGFRNHVEYNIATGHLPSLTQIEAAIRPL